MAIKIVLLLVLLGSILLAAQAKRGNNRYRMEQAKVVDSPMTEAIAQLLGIAGGIYLSLVMTMGFLGMEEPAMVTIGGIMLDPLAMISIVLACIQPIVIRFLRNNW